MNRTIECTTNCTPRIAGLMFVVIIDFILAVPTAAANALVIVAILTTSSLRTPSYLLLTNLAFSDLAVGLFCQPGFALMMIMKLFDNIELNLIFLKSVIIISSFMSCVSVMTITAISVDRYLAIRLKMRYKTVVTVRRVKLFCIFSWVGTPVATFVVLLLRIPSLDGFLGVVAVTGCLLLIVVSYTMSYRALKIHCAQTQPQGTQQPNSTTQSNAIDVLKYRKLLNTMLLIVMVILICYFPILGVLVLFVQRVGPDMFVVIWALMSIVCLNSSLNPLIYLTRMKDIRQACVQIVKKLFKWKD